MIASALILALTLSCAHGSELEKKQSGCENSEVNECQRQTTYDCDCIAVLTEYYECLGYDTVYIYTDEDCGATVTMGATLFSIISVAVAAAFN